MKSNARYKSIVAIVVILIAGAGLLSWIVPTLSAQKEPGQQKVSVSQTKTSETKCLTATETWNNIGKYAFQALYNCLRFAFFDNSAFAYHFGMSHTALYIFTIHSAVK